MPLDKIVVENKRAWALWRIEENETDLAWHIAPFETLSDTIKHPQKRLEWLAARVLVKVIMENLGLVFKGVRKNEFGKPFPIDCDYELALSHSYPYVAALMDTEAVGIDVEQHKPKLLKIAARVLDATELHDAADSVTKHCIYWCAKETLVKVHGKKDLTFAENIKINPFTLSRQGDIVGRIIVDTIETTIPLWYSAAENFVMVLSKKSK